MGGRGGSRARTESGPVSRVSRTWALITDGFTRLWALLSLGFLSILAYRRWLFAAIALLLSAAAVLLLVETAVITSTFALMYHNGSIFYYAFTGVVAAQLAVNGAVHLGHRLRGRVDRFAPAGVGHTRTQDLADAR